MPSFERNAIFDRFCGEELPSRRLKFGGEPDHKQAQKLFPGLNRRMDQRYGTDDVRKRKVLPFFHDRVCSAAVSAKGPKAESCGV